MQEYRAKLFFRDSSSVVGYVKLISHTKTFDFLPTNLSANPNYIKFRLSEKDKWEKWDGIMIHRIKFYTEDGYSVDTYEFVECEDKRGKTDYYLLQLHLEGEVSLYSYFGEQNTFSLSPAIKNPLTGYDYPNTEKEYFATYFVKRKNEKTVTEYVYNEKKMAPYFNCPDLEGQYADLEPLEVVQFYNDFCGEGKTDE
jgi:hypothetical protein